MIYEGFMADTPGSVWGHHSCRLNDDSRTEFDEDMVLRPTLGTHLYSTSILLDADHFLDQVDFAVNICLSYTSRR
jgi:hypothetical protein